MRFPNVAISPCARVAGGLLAALVLVASSLAAQDHPPSSAACAPCHEEGQGDASAPKVVPARPGLVARMLGEKAVQGHASVSCAGQAGADGTLSGCHRPEDGRDGFLVVDVTGRPIDEFCGRCHAEQRQPGRHHPSHKADRDRDGVPESLVIPAAGQEVLSVYAPATLAEPVRTYPDALAWETLPDGSRRRLVALPLETVVEVVDGVATSVADVATCRACHNPHYGYAVEGAGDTPDPSAVQRPTGDALLRLRDYDNSLCEACH